MGKDDNDDDKNNADDDGDDYRFVQHATSGLSLLACIQHIKGIYT